MERSNNFKLSAQNRLCLIFDVFFKYYWYIDMMRLTPGAFTKLLILRRHVHEKQDLIRKKQFKAVKSLVHHAFNNSPYYRDKFNSIRFNPCDMNDWSDFSKIPILTKKDIQQNLDKILSINAVEARLIKDATGGSTGEPLVFYYDRVTKEWFEACDVLVKEWWGIKPWEKKAFLWGADRDIPEMAAKERLKLKLQRSVFLNSFDMDDVKMRKYAKFYEKWKPGYMQGYASSLYLFAQYLKKNNISVSKAKAVRSSAETLYQYQRDLIQEVLGHNVYNFYGSREIPNIAAECPAHQGLHIFSPIRYAEILGSDGEMLNPGEEGKIVVTDLVNYSMPFIRYEIGDIGIMAHNECACGRSFPLLKEVTGRESDFIQTKDGKYIHGEFFTHLFYGVERVVKFQVHQKDLRSLLIHIVKDGPIEPIILDNILKKIKTKMGKDVNVIIRFVDTIPATRTGKHRFTISEIKPTF